MEDNMADKKTVTPEEKQLAAEKHVDGLVKKALVALDEMRKLNQEQVDYIVAKASVAALDAHGILAQHAVEETGRGVFEDKAIFIADNGFSITPSRVVVVTKPSSDLGDI